MAQELGEELAEELREELPQELGERGRGVSGMANNELRMAKLGCELA